MPPKNDGSENVYHGKNWSENGLFWNLFYISLSSLSLNEKDRETKQLQDVLILIFNLVPREKRPGDEVD